MSDQARCATCGCAIQATGPQPQICAECGAKSGLPRPAPPLRSPSPCARCGHREIVRVQMRDRTSRQGGEQNVEVVRPLALTWGHSEEYKALFSFEKVRSAQPALDQPFGLLEAYVCRDCGHTELFARDPGAIPIGPGFGTELLVAPSDGSYR